MTDIDNTTEGIGRPLLDAIKRIRDSAVNCALEDDRVALNQMSIGARRLLDAISVGIAPPDEDEIDDTGTGRLAYEIWVEAQSVASEISERAIAAERLYRDRLVFDDNGVGWAPEQLGLNRP